MPAGYYELRAKLVPALMAAGSVCFGTTSPPIQSNFRTPDNPEPGPVTPEILHMAAHCMVYIKLAHKLVCEAVVGVPQAGEPFAAVFAKTVGAKRIEMDMWEYGGERRIAGVKNITSVGGNIVQPIVLGDALHKGRRLLDTMLNLNGAHFRVKHAIVLVDHEMGGVERLAKYGFTVHSVFTVTELIDDAVANGLMTEYMRAKIGQYLFNA